MYIRRCVNKSKLLLYGPRMVRATCEINVWTCLLQEVRLEHFEIISSVSISTQYRLSKECALYREIEEFYCYSLIFAHMRQAATLERPWEGGLRALSDRVIRKLEKTEEDDRNEEEVTVVLRRPATSQGSKVPCCRRRKGSQRKKRTVKSRNEILQWFHEYKEEKKNEEKKKMDLVTSLSLRFSLLK